MLKNLNEEKKSRNGLEAATEEMRLAPETFDDEFEEALEAAEATITDEPFFDEPVADDFAAPRSKAQKADEAFPTDILAQFAAAQKASEELLGDDDWEDEDAELNEDGPAKKRRLKREQANAPKLKLRENMLTYLAPWIIWISIGCVAASILYALTQGVASGMPWVMLVSGLLLLAGMLIVGSMTKSFSPFMLTGVMMYRAAGRDKLKAVELAGKDILQPLGIAEDILNVDIDARLVTSRDGVVVYANDAYLQIASDAGIRGASGLPPRIDRLFSQSGPESRKIFHLCRSAKSGETAQEIITQVMGLPEAGSGWRRFEISLRPMRDRGEHIAWRLRELEVEDVVDTLSKSYAKYPRPVFGLEPSGQIAWYNEALAEWLGTLTNSLQLSDFILGETEDLIAALWGEEAEPSSARMRKRNGSGGMDIQLTPFLRGGIGEGFVCVELQLEDLTQVEDDQNLLSRDLNEAPFGVAVVEGDIGSDARFMDFNKHFTENFGIDDKTPLLSKCFDEKVIKDLGAAIKSRASGATTARPVEVRIGEGAKAKIIHLHARPVKRRRGSYGKRQTVLYSVDVSFQKRMEEDYSQDQKLKTIGHLVGSIAHDFNNLLLVIMGSCEFLTRRHAVGDPSYPDLVLIQQNALRAKNLTSNLLAFSRKQTLRSEVMSVTEMLQGFSPFLNRSVTERVELNVVNGRAVPKVKADKGQLELAIMNLAVNARDAMPNGGTLRIETRHIPAKEIPDYGYAILEDVDYVLIEVEDSGNGVPPEIADKIFEPFFTTKGEGKGTGLGLSTVYGVIGQMGGRIFLDNKPGEGATFRIFLPALSPEEQEREETTEQKASGEAVDLTGKGRILIVEDEDGARSIIVRALQMCGYEITEACDGDEALEIIEDEDAPFDLVLTDIMMPEMDGPTLILEAGEKLGGAKVIFMSGYAETAMRDKLGDIEGAGYLQKPFSLKVVAAKVKEALQA